MYSYQKTIIKTLKYSVLFILGMAISQATLHYSQYLDMTIGAVLIAIYDNLKHCWGFSPMRLLTKKEEVEK